MNQEKREVVFMIDVVLVPAAEFQSLDLLEMLRVVSFSFDSLFLPSQRHQGQKRWTNPPFLGFVSVLLSGFRVERFWI